MKRRIRVFAIIALLASGIAAQASAQMCNAFDQNSQVVGYAQGPMGMPMPICAGRESPQADAGPREAAPDPMQARTDAAMAQANAMHELIKQQQALLANLDYQRCAQATGSCRTRTAHRIPASAAALPSRA